MGNLDQKPGAWLRRQFEYEFCAECGGDARHHTAVPILGNWFARCDRPPDENGRMHIVVRRYRTRRGYECEPIGGAR